MKMSLWQYAKEWWKGSGETRIFNPLGVSLNSKILVENELLDVTGVRELRYGTRPNDSWTEYTLSGNKFIYVCFDGKDLQYLFGSLHENFEYEETFHKNVLLGQTYDDENGVWIPDGCYLGEYIENGTEYLRVNDLRIPLQCNVIQATDLDNSGNISTNELEEYDVEIFDYVRKNEFDDQEYIFVEMNSDTGYFTVRTLLQIPEEKVQVHK